jgi:hypothetical protein
MIKTISVEEYEQLREEYYGICVNCGEYEDGCEPDLKDGECEYCGRNSVFGIEEALLDGKIVIE